MTTNQQDAMEAAAMAAYIAHHKNGPLDDSFRIEPNMGRGGFKTEVVVWNAVAQAAVQAYLAAREAEGWVWVPSEATEEMGDAGVTLIYERGGAHNVWDVYRAMLAVRP